MTMDATRPRTRRAIIAGAIGGTAALAASSLARPLVAEADDGDSVLMGQMNTESTETTIQTDGPGSALTGESTSQGGTGVSGRSTSPDGDGFGVVGEVTGPGGVGVHGRTRGTTGSSIAVLGICDSPGGAGVRGTATTPHVDGEDAYGVWGDVASGTGVYGTTDDSGTGVSGQSDGPDGTGVGGTGGKYGVWGDSSGTGVFGHTGGLTGVLGFAGVIDMGVPPPDPVAKTGVFGYSNIDAASVGVLGKATTGTGVRAIVTTGTALYATTTNAKSGTALRTVGRVRFDNSVGIATIGAAKFSVTVTPGIDLSSTSAVVATLQANPSGTIAVQGVVVNATSNTFTIYLTATASAAMKVAWHVFG